MPEIDEVIEPDFAKFYLISRDNPRLRQISSPVKKDDKKIQELLVNMVAIMLKNKGIGIAAPQLEILKRVIVIHTPYITQEIINPVILQRSPKKLRWKEGCLSFPLAQIYKQRSARITVTGFNVNWKPVKLRLKKLEAAVIQHEIDHLNGVCIVP